MLFDHGQLVATPFSISHLLQHSITAISLIERHITGDFGDIGEDDVIANQVAILRGERIFSAYFVGDEKIYVITEADRSSTTVLMAFEY